MEAEGCKVYVGNLSFQTEEDQLRELFEAYGPVSDAVVVNDRETGRSRGFGFVTFENSDNAENAIEKLHESDFGGRSIRVSKANARRDTGGGGYGGSRGGGSSRFRGGGSRGRGRDGSYGSGGGYRGSRGGGSQSYERYGGSSDYGRDSYGQSYSGGGGYSGDNYRSGGSGYQSARDW